MTLLLDLLFLAKRIARRNDRIDFLCRFSMVFWARDGLSEPLEEVFEEWRVGLQLTQPISFFFSVKTVTNNNRVSINTQ